MMGRSERTWMVAAALTMLVGCMPRDPLDPRGALEHRTVHQVQQAEEHARTREAFEQARQRVTKLQRGQGIEQVEAALDATVVAEHRDDPEQEKNAPRRKVIDGWLCSVETSPLRKRWLFGYDEDGVVLIGFAIDFTREDPEDDAWVVRGVDMQPHDDCPVSD
jgi:hypothetical protein